ncbi:MAG: PH domain-containing protein [Lachnospira sp.]|uniref:PH domain-containing protein n=1 Tax=Lachnospira pectinoschiza TaxID=28052 RepID=A0A1G9WMY7_9FIRM|nr:PH domain-containing protein [Lachnospira pectinoschiza]MCR5516059.1 PH domain-containing protein [Lachnospira sp.]SDM85864.1 PH domain-containing protein [Lachnospira pectinoschiza]
MWKERKRLWCGLPWTFTVYSGDDQRLFVESGFFNKNQDECRLYRILDISVTRSFGQRLFGLGTIKLCTSDKTLGDFEIKNIRHVMQVKEELSQSVEIMRDKKRVTSREFLGHDEDEHEEFDGDYDN